MSKTAAPQTPDPVSSTTRWASRHGVISALIPFAHRNVDVVNELSELRQAIDALPKTAASFTLANLDTYRTDGKSFTRPTSTNDVSTLLAVQGALPYDETMARTRWLNPAYVHATPFEDPRYSERERLKILRHAASLGTITLADVAGAFGVAPVSLREWLSERGLSWATWKREGCARLARTLKLIATWQGESIKAVARKVRTPYPTVTHLIREYASDFDVPADPYA